ncbi:SGNH/GDSL hydrolase family protein [Algoriphagus limi]|uniref:SGNH/GDSL hydrolase family protein n=1 Tax=Algoriphagus limi TaxID=2975273 RepID=A0ABT2G333_9BACT|nr:SGNH/GDSL hydrolase family protein [Algoriphagus limi]MCS5489673.1 SGNH/GDSL hydrolase family protein [Algoriphagus limi]
MKGYWWFQTQLYPMLPYLIYQAKTVRKNNPLPPANSNHLILGNSQKRILILGESTAAGMGASQPETTLAGNIFRLFQEKYQVINLGKNGLRAKELIPTFKEDLEINPSKVEGVFLFIGANDCFRLTKPLNYKSELENIISWLKKNFSPNWIYLSAIPPVHIFPAFTPQLKYFLLRQRKFLSSEMEQIASQDSNVIYQEIRFDLTPEFFADDGIHPSDKGYQGIAQFAFDGIKRWSKRSKEDIF